MSDDQLMFKRVIIVVIDSLGIGALPDAGEYGDRGSDTLGNVSRALGGISLPTLESLGLGNIKGVSSISPVDAPLASYGRMAEASKGKDTATGHWEMAGIITKRPFPTYPEGLPEDILDRFSRLTGGGYLGGKPASGTEIMERLGPEHMATGAPIVYTSADSVFQIAAHIDVIPLDRLYEICEVTREFTYEYNIQRVIARPFRGSPGSFVRTPNRRDYPVAPPEGTLLDLVYDKGGNGGKALTVAAIGKVGDIFAHRSITREYPGHSNREGIESTIAALGDLKEGLIFTNLNDLDSHFGHRNDVAGYGESLKELDKMLPDLLSRLTGDDLLIITADHGCDPTMPSTDHSREYVPLIAYSPPLVEGGGEKGRGAAREASRKDLGTRATFADIGESVAENFGIQSLKRGSSFLNDLFH